jgi:hypothetical protein
MLAGKARRRHSRFEAQPPRPNMRRTALVILAALIPVLAAHAQEPAKIRAAVFDFELIDTSLEGEKQGPRPDEQARLAHLGQALREKLAASKIYAPVDIAPVEAEAHRQNLQSCGGCDAKMARELGADVAITGAVQKVSNLILNINIYIRDARTGRATDAMSVDIRGNTDESWMHGLDWLLRNKLLASAADRRP